MQNVATKPPKKDPLEQAQSTISELQEENHLLREQLRLYKAKLYGRGTEKAVGLSNEQQLQLDLTDNEANEPEEDPPAEPDMETFTVTRKKRGKRKPIPAFLPRRDIFHDIDESQKMCGCGQHRVEIGRETSERLEIIPAQIEVLRHIRPKYACPACEGLEASDAAVVIAPPPAEMLPKSMVGPGLLAGIITEKFADGLPFYRQVKRFDRLGIRLDRTTMANWAMKVANRCKDLLALMHREVLAYDWLQIDETTLQVMREEDRSNKVKSFMWVIRGGPPDQPIVYFHYHPSRRADVAKGLLEGFEGYVQTDGYKGYEFLGQQPKVIHVGCWAHVRRKFTDVVKSSGRRKGKGKKSYAEMALDYIGELYRLEREAKEGGVFGPELLELRQTQGKAAASRFRDWLEKVVGKVPPDALLGKAIKYTLSLWPRLLVYLDTDFAPPDTNLVENAIRPFVVGRKNWMLAGSPNGASASACLYSLVETAKANGWEPNAYFYFLFQHLPKVTSNRELRDLLPFVAKPIPMSSQLASA